MLKDNNDPTTMEGNNEQPTPLNEVIQTFKDCRDRSFQPLATPERIAEPDKEKDQPLPLAKYRSACQEIDTDELMPETLKEKHLKTIDVPSLTSLAKKYPAGAKICLSLVPVQANGLPSVEFHMLEVDAKGLTFGYTSDPAYYFLLFPKEVQEQCTFRVPFYENIHYPTETERQELKKRFLQAWDNLKQLLDKKKKAA